MKNSKLKCNLCGKNKYTLVYEGVIRSGVYGRVTDKIHRVIKCYSCGLIRLESNPLDDDYYNSSAYRLNYNGSTSVDQYINDHDMEQPPRIADIGVEAFRNKIVLDFGCGGGSFLDMVSGVSKKTVGIEPYSKYHSSLRKRGHQVYSSSLEALNELNQKVDTIVSFGVIEHVEKPVSYLKDAFNLLTNDGTMYLETDNHDDILLELEIPNIESFYYRDVHLWYFDSTTIQKTANTSGFSNVTVTYRHNYDLSNSFMWAMQGKPTGCGKIRLFNKALDSAWISFIEKNGYADLVCAKMRKK
ncbi:class I SAM-dependent methyltransferase [Verrucomicrobia bacterium]|nr:class I SAM-dependent methyltransferase [Verrucomicrobiota bacterium]